MMNRPAAAAAIGSRLPEFSGVAPRVSANDLTKYRGQFVTLVAKPFNMDEQQRVNMTEVVAEARVDLCDAPENAEYSQINEFVVYVNPATGALQYHSHGTLNDDFDCDMYKKLLSVLQKHPGLF